MSDLARTPIPDLADGARHHYERVSFEAHDWYSLIPHAIDRWEQVEMARGSWWRRILLRIALRKGGPRE